MITRAQELREKRGRIHAEAQRILEKKSLTAEDRAKFDGMMTEMDALKGDIDRLERADTNENELRQSTRPPEAQIGGTFETSVAERRYAECFNRYLRFGPQGLDQEDLTILRERQQRDMGTGGGNALTGTGGGYFVPVGFVNRVEEAMLWYGDMLNVATILDTATGQPLPHPTDNDVSNVGEIVAEHSQVSAQDVTVGSILLGAFKFSTKLVKVSLELAQDSAFDMQDYLAKKFGTRLGRILNNKFTVGVGTTEPLGIITAATASGVTVVGDDNATSPDPTKEIGYLDLLGLEHSVDISYRRGAKWMFHDTTLRFIKGLKDKYGHPLWLPGIAVNAPDTIPTRSTTTWTSSRPGRRSSLLVRLISTSSGASRNWQCCDWWSGSRTTARSPSWASPGTTATSWTLEPIR